MRGRVAIARLLLVAAPLVCAAHAAFAGSVSISWKATDAPAVDLIYKGQPIDRDEAIDLRNQGIDLSTLDPMPNDVWQPTPAAPASSGVVYPPEGATVDFDGDMASASSMFRTRVTSGVGAGAQAFQLMMSLNGHASLARAALLRKLGYPIPITRRYSKLTIRFADVETRDRFLDDLSDATLTARKRWVVTLPEHEPWVTVQDVILEPGQIDMPMYHWGVIPASHLKGRRAVRALIVPNTLLDINESVNMYSWELGKTIDNSVILTQAYADSFAETTIDDARWIARRIAKLSRADFEQAIAEAQYPDDVAKLLVEKAIARRDHMVEMFHLDPELGPELAKLPYDLKISAGAVKNGKLTKADYDGYALRFSYGDPESPLRASEIGKFLLVKGISNAIGAATAIANKYMTVQGPGDVILQHANDVAKDYFQFAHDHPGELYKRPLGVWAGPIGGFGVQASRDIVSGTYFGSDSKVQLVDNLAFQANVGFFMGVDGIPVVGIGATGNVVLQRNYIHIKPIADMGQALKSNWKDVFVPAFLGELNSTLGGSTNDQPQIDERLKKFLDTLKEGEMLVLTDSLIAGVQGQVNVSVPLFLTPILNPNLGLGVSGAPMILRRTTFRRTADGVQIYMQNAQVLEADVEFNFNWIVNIVRLTHTTKKGWGHTKAYLLDREPDSPEERRHLFISLRALLAGHDSEVLEENFQDYELSHDSLTHINAANLLAWRFAGISESHKVTVTPPGHPESPRILFSNRLQTIKGLDGFGFLSDIAAGLTGGLVRLANNKSTAYNPAYSFLGSGNWLTAVTEAEITPKYEFAPVTTISHHFGGWSLSRKGLMKVLDGMEKQARRLNLDHALVRRDEFSTTNSLQLYEVQSILIIYQPAMKHISETVFEKPRLADVVSELIAIEGKQDLERYCGGAGRKVLNFFFSVDGYSEREHGKKVKFSCLKPWMIDLLKERHKYLTGHTPKTAETHVKWINNFMRELEKKIDLAKLLRWLGHDNYFFQIRVSGFRTGDENGDSEYLSDSVGTFDNKLGGGVFRDFAGKYGIMQSELSAQYLSEGF